MPDICHVAHIIFQFSMGGLEQSLANLISWLPQDQYRHSVIALTESVPELQHPAAKQVATYIVLKKPPGHGWRVYRKCHQAIQSLSPHIVHTHNLAAQEMLLTSLWHPKPPRRLHTEHGRNENDLQGSRIRHKVQRYLFSKLSHEVIAVSQETQQYLINTVGISAKKVRYLPNGIDCQAFNTTHSSPPKGWPFSTDAYVFCSVMRLTAVKNPLQLIQSFLSLRQRYPSQTKHIRLALIGDGPLMQTAQHLIAQSQYRDEIWLPGQCQGIAAILKYAQVFVLPSLVEGQSISLLEAMASGCACIATAVGDNAVLLGHDQERGKLIPAHCPEALSQAMLELSQDIQAGQRLGNAAQQWVCTQHDRSQLTERYHQRYQFHFNAWKKRY